MKPSSRWLLPFLFFLLFVNSAFAVYDPRLRRWLSRDPIGEEGGFNRYAYCGNDPINRHDYLGLDDIEVDDDFAYYLVQDKDSGLLGFLRYTLAGGRHRLGLKVGNNVYLQGRFRDNPTGGISVVEFDSLKAGAAASWIRNQSIEGGLPAYQEASILKIISEARGGGFSSKGFFSETGAAVHDRVGDLSIGIANLFTRKNTHWSRLLSAKTNPEFYADLYGDPEFNYTGADVREVRFPSWSDSVNPRSRVYTGTQTGLDWAQDAAMLYPFARVGVLNEGRLLTAAEGRVWTMAPFDRGLEIENKLARRDYKDWFRVGATQDGTFPLVDFQKGGNLASLKTVDTGGSTWLSRMQEHIDELATNGATVNGNPASVVSY